MLLEACLNCSNDRTAIITFFSTTITTNHWEDIEIAMWRGKRGPYPAGVTDEKIEIVFDELNGMATAEGQVSTVWEGMGWLMLGDFLNPDLLMICNGCLEASSRGSLPCHGQLCDDLVRKSPDTTWHVHTTWNEFLEQWESSSNIPQ